jgi:hypothetical protein
LHNHPFSFDESSTFVDETVAELFIQSPTPIERVKFLSYLLWLDLADAIKSARGADRIVGNLPNWSGTRPTGTTSRGSSGGCTPWRVVGWWIKQWQS